MILWSCAISRQSSLSPISLSSLLLLLNKLQPWTKWFGVKLLQSSSSFIYVNARPLNVLSISIGTVFNLQMAVINHGGS